jgi:hypothetical protein
MDLKDMPTKSQFKVCPSCKFLWDGRDSFLSDPKVHLVGYQVNFDDLERGMFLFNHEKPGCRTTLAIEAHRFTDMYDGPVFRERLTGKEGKCPGHCLYENQLQACPSKCDCAYVRAVLQKVEHWPKATQSEITA